MAHECNICHGDAWTLLKPGCVECYECQWSLDGVRWTDSELTEKNKVESMSKVKSYVKRQIAVQAIECLIDNIDDICKFTSDVVEFNDDGKLCIDGPTGEHFANPGDWIMKGGDDDFYVCPADFFDANYRSYGHSMGYGAAIEAMKDNKRVAREGWNGKGLYVCIIWAGNAMHKGMDMKDCFGIKTVSGDMQPGWVASTSDSLGEDWHIVDE